MRTDSAIATATRWVRSASAYSTSPAAGADRREPRVDARTAVDRAFVDVLAGGAPAEGLVDYAEALRTHRVAVAIAEAARTGDAVRPSSR